MAPTYTIDQIKEAFLAELKVPGFSLKLTDERVMSRWKSFFERLDPRDARFNELVSSLSAEEGLLFKDMLDQGKILWDGQEFIEYHKPGETKEGKREPMS